MVVELQVVVERIATRWLDLSLWVQCFRVDSPAIVTPMLDALGSLTGMRPIALHRRHNDRLVHGTELPSRTALVDGLIGAIDTEREALRNGAVECVRLWLAGVIDDLVAAAYIDASPVAPRATGA